VAERPGDLIQVDTVNLTPLPGLQRRQFTAVDAASRIGVAEARGVATAGTAPEFPDSVQSRLPFVVKAVQVDGGSEFKAAFAAECQARGIRLCGRSPRSPKLNGMVERLKRTAHEEFWKCCDGELDLPPLKEALRAWETTYHAIRPHQALGHRTTAAHLAALQHTNL
jgi:transposase InsO family protein